MSQSPYRPPRSPLADPPAGPPPLRPQQVTLATALLWISFALGFPSWYMGALRYPEYGFETGMLAFTAILFTLSALLNVLVYRGRNWARILLLALFIIGALLFLLPTDEPITPSHLEYAFNVSIFLLEVVALYLLFSEPGAHWYRPRD